VVFAVVRLEAAGNSYLAVLYRNVQ
jgi:hypothetical protein